MMMKKLKFTKLAFLGLFLSLGTAHAQDMPVQLSGTTTQTGYPGDIVRVPVVLDTDITDEGIIALRLEFSYSNMTPVGVYNTGGIIASWDFNDNISSGRLVFSAAGATPIAQTGALFYIDFELHDVTYATTGYYNLHTSGDNYLNEGGYEISMTSGQVSIQPRPKLTVNPANNTITKGESTVINISGGTPPYTVTVLESDLAEVVSENSVSGKAPGIVHVNAVDAEGVEGTTTVEVRGFKLGFEAPEGLFYPGDVVDITLSTTDLVSLGVLSGTFGFYLSQDLALQEIVSTGTLLEGAEIEYADVSSTWQPEYQLSFAHSATLASGTSLLKLRVAISETATGSFSLAFRDDVVFNEDLRGNYTSSGSYTITQYPTPTISAANLPSVIFPGDEIQFQANGGTPPYVWSLTQPETGNIDALGLLSVSKSGDPKVVVEDANGQTAQTATLQVYDGILKIDDVTIPFNTEYSIPVLVTELPVASGYSAFDVQVDINNTYLEFVEVVKAVTLSESFSLVVNQDDPSKIRIVAASTSKINAAGVLFYFKVQLKEAFTSGSTSITMNNVVFNEGFPVLKVENGNISVGDPPPVAGNSTITVDEDGTYSFSSTDFSYSQSQGNPFTGIRIESLPAIGVLKYAGNAVYTGQVISVNDLGQLQYIPDANKFGDGLTSFTVKVSDADKLSDNTGTVAVNVNAVNDPPVFTLSTSAVTVLRNFATTETVEVVLGTAPFGESAETYTYTMEPSEVAFANVAINATTGTVTITSKADQSGSATITVTASDGQASNNTASQAFTLQVNTPNEAPVISDQSFSVAENRTAGTVVGSVAATDANGDALTYNITAGNTNSAFSINAGGELVVATASALDFEVTPSFTLTVEVSDGSLTSSATITVNLTDVDESVNQAPQIVAQSFTIDENKANGSVVGTASASDPDGSNLTWSITAGNTNDAFAIDAGTGQITVANATALDYEGVTTFSLTIEVNDGSLTASATITVNLTDIDESINQAPQISDQSFTIAENRINGTLVGTLSASDANNDALAFSITAGNSDTAFAIDANTGQITVINGVALDFEAVASFSLTVQVSDGSLDATATVTIAITDVDESVNQAPQIVDQSFAIAENTANGTLVGTVTAGDADGDALTFSITAGNSGDAFAIDPTSGEITVSNSNALDFETTTAYNLEIEVSDGSLNASGQATVNITDVEEAANQAPQIADQTFSVVENTASGTAVGTVAASDPDGDPLTFSITGGNTGDAFAIDTNTGELTVADESVLDFEALPSFSLTVQATDGIISSSATITVDITDKDESVTGVSGNELLRVNVYPNPAHSQCFLKMEHEVLRMVYLIDISGKRVKTIPFSHVGNGTARLEIEDVGPGSYFLELHTNNSKLTKRLMIE